MKVILLEDVKALGKKKLYLAEEIRSRSNWKEFK